MESIIFGIIGAQRAFFFHMQEVLFVTEEKYQDLVNVSEDLSKWL